MFGNKCYFILVRHENTLQHFGRMTFCGTYVLPMSPVWLFDHTRLVDQLYTLTLQTSLEQFVWETGVFCR